MTAMVTTAPALYVLDPTAGPVQRDTPIAPGIEDLAGKRIGLLHNNKRGGQEFLDFVAELLAGRYDGIEFVRSRKLDVSSPCPPRILDELVDKTDLVITAIGD